MRVRDRTCSTCRCGECSCCCSQGCVSCKLFSHMLCNRECRWCCITLHVSCVMSFARAACKLPRLGRLRKVLVSFLLHTMNASRLGPPLRLVRLCLKGCVPSLLQYYHKSTPPLPKHGLDTTSSGATHDGAGPRHTVVSLAGTRWLHERRPVSPHRHGGVPLPTDLLLSLPCMCHLTC